LCGKVQNIELKFRHLRKFGEGKKYKICGQMTKIFNCVFICDCGFTGIFFFAKLITTFNYVTI